MSIANHYTGTCSTKRATVSSGQRGAKTTYLSNLVCTPLYPDSNGELRMRAALNTPTELWRLFIAGANDIVQGDSVVVGGVDYTIRAIARYPASPTGAIKAYSDLVLEKVLAS